jgi:hypothetical protein
VTKHFDASDYLDHPERAVALLNRVIGAGGSDQAIGQAVAVLVRSLKRAGFRDGRRGPRDEGSS